MKNFRNSQGKWKKSNFINLFWRCAALNEFVERIWSDRRCISIGLNEVTDVQIVKPLAGVSIEIMYETAGIHHQITVRFQFEYHTLRLFKQLYIYFCFIASLQYIFPNLISIP